MPVASGSRKSSLDELETRAPAPKWQQPCLAVQRKDWMRSWRQAFGRRLCASPCALTTSFAFPLFERGLLP